MKNIFEKETIERKKKEIILKKMVIFNK